MVEIPLAQVVVGDSVLVGPGERVAVDGEVIEGSTEIDESMLTGEALPVMKQPGDSVTGGTVNTTGAITVRALRVGSDSTLARIVRAVEDAQGSKAPVQRLADKIASIFVPCILGISLITFCIWFFFIPPAGANTLFTQSLLPAIAVIVVACPCALGLATPTALMVGMGKGAQLGILIKDGEALERLGKLDAAVFDKTGTITVGKPQVVSCSLTPENLRLAAALETKSEHPLARAVVEYAKARGLVLPSPSSFRALVGEGVEGEVEGRQMKVGSSVFVDGASVGGFEFSDEAKPDAQQTIEELKQSYGITSYMVTGDNAVQATRIASEVGIAADNVFAGVKPLEKAECVEAVKASLEAADPRTSSKQITRTVAFVGDRINDAPALAAADVGVAMASGTDVALEAGSVVLMRNRVHDLVTSLRLSKATMRKIKQNLFWALIYNCIMIPLAAVGILAPARAGAAMALSSVTVVCNSLLLKRFQ